MIVTLISQCEKKALNKTRRVLDAFANRIGSNTWQTVITEQGLQAVKKLLRKTATKNTAVSCHKMRGRQRTELVWIVGKRNKFNSLGNVPVNTTRRNLLNSHIENDWHYLPLIKALTAIAALFHDWGKATHLFQHKLDPSNHMGFKGDPIRHEWISVLLLKAIIQSTINQSDQEWLVLLTEGQIDEANLLKNSINNSINPLSNLPPLAQLVAWLIVSHHRLPLTDKDYRGENTKTLNDLLKEIDKTWGYENRYDEEEYQSRIKSCFQFPKGLMSQSKAWIKELKKWSQRLINNKKQAEQSIQNGSYRLILSHSRLCLMLGDHYYSSQEADNKWPDTTGLFANTDRVTKVFKQKLDEHLVGVAKSALITSHLLPSFETEPPKAQDINNLKKRSPPAFQWQDKAVEKILEWQKPILQTSQIKYGFFAVNMASTGCGKTFANAKIMRALSFDQQSLRFILALGLRTLTLQTGDEYRERIGLDNTELAVLIGSKAVMELHQQAKMDLKKESYENSGSLSEEHLLDEELDFECALPEHKLSTVLTCDRDRQFLYAPVLSCTIDHMMAATETKRGGRYILPTLRLMSSDLVIDEIDDFTGNDLIAIGRLIHLAGMLGRKVMISSATIPPDLAEGYFNAYRDGWQLYCKTRNANKTIGCAWIDEFSTQVDSNHIDETPQAILNYRQSHAQFIKKRVVKLKQQPAKRKADISNCQQIIDDHKGKSHIDKDVIKSKQTAFFGIVAQSILIKHQHHHTQDKATQLNISFGVVRVANIRPCIDLTQYLLEKDWPQDIQVRVMAYHSQQVLLMRSVQERHLDAVLKRKEKKNEDPKAFSNPIIRQHLDQIKKQSALVKQVIFILVATPVEEVGRDHDFDWAVIEPSSFRSIIQLAGRVKRHREGEEDHANISLMQYNWLAIRDHHIENNKAYKRPGFEERIQLTSHNLNKIIPVTDIQNNLNAIPRIQKPEQLNASYMQQIHKAKNLVELEHEATWYCLAYYKNKGPNTLQGYLKQPWFLTALPQKYTPFREGPPTKKLFLVFDEHKEVSRFCEKNDDGFAIDRENILNIKRIKLSNLATSRLWLQRDFDNSCQALAEKQSMSQRTISLRYGEINLPHNEKKEYGYSDQLGLVKNENK